jgi:hypothetical protein
LPDHKTPPKRACLVLLVVAAVAPVAALVPVAAVVAVAASHLVPEPSYPQRSPVHTPKRPKKGSVVVGHFSFFFFFWVVFLL